MHSYKEMNTAIINRAPDCQTQITRLKKIELFLADFSFLNFGRDFVFYPKWVLSVQNIAVSLELTMGNIISCCESGCIADANALLRKYRDDLFFYLYIKVYDSIYKFDQESLGAENMRNRISDWLKNEQKNLYLKEVLEAIESDIEIKEAIDKYRLKSAFDDIGRRLNNFVHSNGYGFYNRNINAYHGDEFFQELKTTVDDAAYLTTAFVFLLTLCSPSSIASTDYIDYLECGKTPPEESQYWVAPFVQRFLQENCNLINENAYAYLKDTCNMDL